MSPFLYTSPSLCLPFSLPLCPRKGTVGWLVGTAFALRRAHPQPMLVGLTTALNVGLLGGQFVGKLSTMDRREWMLTFDCCLNIRFLHVNFRWLHVNIRWLHVNIPRMYIGFRELLPIGMERMYWRFFCSDHERRAGVPLWETFDLPGIDLPAFTQDLTERDRSILWTMVSGAAAGYFSLFLQCT